MNKTKVFFGGQRLKDMYVGASKFEVFKYRVVRTSKRVIVVTGMLSALSWSAVLGSHAFPSVVYAEKTVHVAVDMVSPVMDRIALCESGGKHYKAGQVLIMANTNKTVDIGYYQINSIWNKTASNMGYDLTKEEDNKAFGRWLYANYGTEPWVYSKACWNK